MRTIFVLVFVFVLALVQASQKDACAQFLHTQQCLDKALEQQEPCIAELHQKYLQCKYVMYGEGVKNVAPPKPTAAPTQFCKVNTGFKPNSCLCRFKQICTPRLCYCYQTFEACVQTRPFSRRSVCLCGKGKKRTCTGATCVCAVQTIQPVKPALPVADTWKKLSKCKLNVNYKRESCFCAHVQKCIKDDCRCHNKVAACPATGNFDRKILCGCKGKASVRSCKGTTCTCKKVKACNLFRSYTSRASCFCKQDFRFMACQTVPSAIAGQAPKRECRCEHLAEKCPMNKTVKRGSCWCDFRVNSWKCNKGPKGVTCTCTKKPFCPLDTPINRQSCRCQVRPTVDLQDENSEKKRVYRKYGWKKCRPSNPKKIGSPSICECQALPCYEAGRFKKYFCKCPRLTKQYCNKKTGYCKCLWKKPRAKVFNGVYKFRGLIKVSSLLLASFKYEKRKISVYTKEKMQAKEPRYVFVDHNNGSFYVVRKPSIKNDVELRAEMALYDAADQNAKEIQKQLKKKMKKVYK